MPSPFFTPGYSHNGPIGEIGNFFKDVQRNAIIGGTKFLAGGKKSSPVIKPKTTNAASRHKALGKLGAPEVRDPMQDLMDFANSQGRMVGGSGGSGGNGAAIAALVAQINKNRDAANARYQTNKSQITDMYGQLRDELAPNAGLTAARYNTAIDQAKVGGQGIANTTTANMNAQNAQRNAALGQLGVDPTVGPSEENAATNRGLADLAQSNASWGNLQAVLSNAQQSRDQLDVQGATDAGILANRELTGNFEDYMRQLDDQVAQARSSYSPGSGGSPAHYENPLMDTVNDAILGKLIGAAGLGPEPKPGPNLGNPMALLGAYGDGISPNSSGPLSKAELMSRIGTSKDPMGALMALKYFG